MLATTTSMLKVLRLLKEALSVSEQLNERLMVRLRTADGSVQQGFSGLSAI